MHIQIDRMTRGRKDDTKKGNIYIYIYIYIYTLDLKVEYQKTRLYQMIFKRGYTKRFYFFGKWLHFL